MPRFFCEYFKADPKITGEDARHISRSLRMKIGENLTVCDTKGTDFLCKIKSIDDEAVYLEILEEARNASEPNLKATLFQCMPKGDKLDLVVQKAVELGVGEIVPVMSSRCVSRPDKKSADKKIARLKKIADEAAKQSGRGILPEISPLISFKECCGRLGEFQKSLIFYELGGKPLRELVDNKTESVAIIVGPEGGLSADEVAEATRCGAIATTLGKRILRTETAPIAALAAIMLLSENLE